MELVIFDYLIIDYLFTISQSRQTLFTIGQHRQVWCRFLSLPEPFSMVQSFELLNDIVE